MLLYLVAAMTYPYLVEVWAEAVFRLDVWLRHPSLRRFFAHAILLNHLRRLQASRLHRSNHPDEPLNVRSHVPSGLHRELWNRLLGHGSTSRYRHRQVQRQIQSPKRASRHKNYLEIPCSKAFQVFRSTATPIWGCLPWRRYPRGKPLMLYDLGLEVMS